MGASSSSFCFFSTSCCSCACFITFSIRFFISSCWICRMAMLASMGERAFAYSFLISYYSLPASSGSLANYLLMCPSICNCIVLCWSGEGIPICIWGMLRIMWACIFRATFCCSWNSLRCWPALSAATSSLNFCCSLNISTIRGYSRCIIYRIWPRLLWKGSCGIRYTKAFAQFTR